MATHQLGLVITRRGLQDHLALIALLSWVFLLRLQAECFPLARQKAGEHLLNDDRLLRKGATGLLLEKLVIKRNRQKHAAAGATFARGRICREYPEGSLELHAPNSPSRRARCGRRFALGPKRERGSPRAGPGRRSYKNCAHSHVDSTGTGRRDWVPALSAGAPRWRF